MTFFSIVDYPPIMHIATCMIKKIPINTAKMINGAIGYVTTILNDSVNPICFTSKTLIIKKGKTVIAYHYR